MEKIKSFTVNHTDLMPGVYVSRTDCVSAQDAFSPLGSDAAPHDALDEATLYPITTYDIRITRPNREPVMGTGEIHTIEHLGATYLRNRADLKCRVIYWGPMGCRTGFYLILAGAAPAETVLGLMIEVFDFIAGFEGDIPGATPAECGNCTDMDLPAAKLRAARYRDTLQNDPVTVYPE